jgi:hypothetical protein
LPGDAVGAEGANDEEVPAITKGDEGGLRQLLRQGLDFVRQGGEQSPGGWAEVGGREEGVQRQLAGGRVAAAGRVAGRRAHRGGGGRPGRLEEGGRGRQEQSHRRFDPRGHRGSTGERPSRSFFLSGRPASNHGPNLGAE